MILLRCDGCEHDTVDGWNINVNRETKERYVSMQLDVCSDCLRDVLLRIQSSLGRFCGLQVSSWRGRTREETQKRWAELEEMEAMGGHPKEEPWITWPSS